MNNTFELSRFKKIVVYDYHQYLHRFGIVLAILIGVSTLGTWITSLSFGSWETLIEGIYVPPVARYMAISYIFWLAVWIAPAWIYGFINMKKDGPQYATLPASYMEKFLSILFYTLIVTPIVFSVGCFAVDTLLALLPWGGYKEFIWNYTSTEVVEFLGASPMLEYMNPQSGKYILLGILSTLSTSSLMFFTSTIFKKHKVSKTFGVIAILSFALLIVLLASLPVWIEYFEESIEGISDPEYVAEYIENRLVPTFMRISIIASAIQTVVCYVWGYFRMKRIKF